MDTVMSIEIGLSELRPMQDTHMVIWVVCLIVEHRLVVVVGDCVVLSEIIWNMLKIV